MNVLKSFLAWVTGPLKPEVVPMSEVTDSASPALAPAPAATAVPVVAPPPAPVAPVSPGPVSTDTLKAVLIALGHDLDAVWDDAVALARKAR